MKMKLNNPSKNWLQDYGRIERKKENKVVSSTGKILTIVGWRLPLTGELYLKPTGRKHIYHVFIADCNHEKTPRLVIEVVP